METTNASNAPDFSASIRSDYAVGASSESTEETQSSGDQTPTNTGVEAPADTNVEAKSVEQGEEKSVTPSTEAPSEFTDIINGWKEDRKTLTTLESENRAMKDELAQVKTRLSQYEGDGYEDTDKAENTQNLTEQQIIERYEAQKAQAEEKRLSELKSELIIKRAEDPFFKAHEKECIEMAEAMGANNLDQALIAVKAKHASIEKAKQATIMEERRKQGASGQAGGDATGKAPIKGYDPARDRDKTFAQLYREGGF